MANLVKCNVEVIVDDIIEFVLVNKCTSDQRWLDLVLLDNNHFAHQN